MGYLNQEQTAVISHFDGTLLVLNLAGGDPLELPMLRGYHETCPPVIRREEIEFFLRLYGLWESIIQLARPPPPPFDIDTMEPIELPWQATKE